MTTQASVPPTKELLEELRVMCAETLEIPIDEVTVDADLSADLGADSLTMDELLIVALGRYGMEDRAVNVQVSSYPTISALADLIEQLNDEGNNAQNSGPDD
jgi:acyl carrier protein